MKCILLCPNLFIQLNGRINHRLGPKFGFGQATVYSVRMRGYGGGSLSLGVCYYLLLEVKNRVGTSPRELVTYLLLKIDVGTNRPLSWYYLLTVDGVFSFRRHRYVL